MHIYSHPRTSVLPRVEYLDIYTVNLESDVNFTVFYDLIYIYIYILFTVRGRPVTGQPTQGFFYILWLISDPRTGCFMGLWMFIFFFRHFCPAHIIWNRYSQRLQIECAA